MGGVGGSMNENEIREGCKVCYVKCYCSYCGVHQWGE